MVDKNLKCIYFFFDIGKHSKENDLQNSKVDTVKHIDIK